MGFDDRLWTHLVEHHDAHLADGPSRPAPRHPAARRGTAAGAVALAAAAAGVIVIDRPAGQSWAQQTLRRAAAVVIPPPSPHTILHVAATETLSPLAQRDSATTVSTISEEAWIQQGRPWGKRSVAQVPGGPVLEQDSSGRVFDRTSDTLLPGPTIPSGKPPYTLTPLGGGKYRVSAPLPNGRPSTPLTVDSATIKAIRDGSQAVSWSVGWDGHTQRIGPMVGPSLRYLRETQGQDPDPGSTSFAPELRGLLDSGHARVIRTTTDLGRPAIEISSVHPQSGPQTNYFVDPRTYRPLELDIFGFDNPKDITRVRFTTYETLPLAGHRGLLRLDVPSTAHVDHTPADYWRAAGLPRPF